MFQFFHGIRPPALSSFAESDKLPGPDSSEQFTWLRTFSRPWVVSREMEELGLSPGTAHHTVFDTDPMLSVSSKAEEDRSVPAAAALLIYSNVVG